MSIKSNAEQIEAGKIRLKKVKQLIKELDEEPKITSSVKNFLTINKLSLKSAIKKGYIDINLVTGKYVVTKKGNKFKQRGMRI